MTNSEKRELLETLFKENLADKVYLSDEENEKLLNGDPSDIPDDLYLSETKEGNEIVKRLYKYTQIENCDALLKMKLLKKSRLTLIITGISLMLSLISLIVLLVIVLR